MTAVVAVTGAGVLCSIADSLDTFAHALRVGRSGIALRRRTDDGPALTGADLPDFDFAAAVAAWDLPEHTRREALRAAGRAPLAVRAGLLAAVQGWVSAGLHRSAPDGDRVGLVVGGQNLSGAYSDRMRPRYASSPSHLPARYGLHVLDTDHVGVLSRVLGIRGEGYTVGGASASGNVAIANGCRLITSGTVDVCVVVGALADLSDMEWQAFINMGAMAAPDRPGPAAGRAGPFDAGRAGFVPGQATACLVLEAADSAHLRGATALGQVLGHGSGLDGNSLADPNAGGQAAAMGQALRRAGLEPAAVDYVNAHGTGSRVGDETEVAALRAVFGPDVGRPWINATKGLIGHTLWAAGVVEAVATLVQMRDGFVHPNVNLARPVDDACRFVGAAAVPATIGVALSNAFGFGGINSSVVLAAPGRTAVAGVDREETV